MDSKARVHAALRRQPVDRVPIFMWFHPETAHRLAGVLDIPVNVLAEVMGNDVRQAWVSNNHAMEGIVHEHDGDAHVDQWGIEWVKDGPFNQIRHSPLDTADDADLAGYTHPYEHADELLSNMNPVLAQAERFFVGCDVSPCVFEMVARIRGLEHTLFDLAARPAVARQMLKQAGRFAVHLSEQACTRFALDWLWAGDDVGGQFGMMMSPDCWREMILPELAEIFAVGKSRGLWVAFHCCGAIRPLIPDLIEAGLDVLNPIQCNCPGMAPVELKAEFGADIAFMGGVDTQDLLPHATADEVRRATAELLEQMTAGGGGYILAASHTVPPETPLENIWAMYDAAGLGAEEIFDRAADARRRSV